MVRLLKMIFWLTLVVIMLPDNKERSANAAYNTAKAVYSDTLTFCDRHPQTCIQNRHVANEIGTKAKRGIRTVADAIREDQLGREQRNAYSRPTTQPQETRSNMEVHRPAWLVNSGTY
jgi:hypothetical protein